MSEPKDFWVKAEIVGKVLVPIVVSVSVWLWNADRTEFQTTATMTQISIDVLTGEPAESGSNALREWAISVLRNPANPPSLSEAAAVQLRGEGYNWFLDPSSKFLESSQAEFFAMTEKMQRIVDELSLSAPPLSDE